MDNFNLKNFILENKLARASKLVESETDKLEEINKENVAGKIRAALRDVLFVGKNDETKDRYLSRENVIDGSVSKEEMFKRYNEVIDIMKDIIGEYESTKNGYKS